jgi:hypothetical protein
VATLPPSRLAPIREGLTGASKTGAMEEHLRAGVALSLAVVMTGGALYPWRREDEELHVHEHVHGEYVGYGAEVIGTTNGTALHMSVTYTFGNWRPAPLPSMEP